MKVDIPNRLQYLEAVRQFSENCSTLKIVVKTKDEVEFTRAWIEHHRKIVGLQNIIIADNGSTSAAVIEIYQSYGNALNWFTFTGHHDEIHHEPGFPELYQKIREKSRYVAFLDMDERLLELTPSSWRFGQNIARKLATSEAALVMAPWLQNTPNHADQFELYKEQLAWGIYFGKPLLSSRNKQLGSKKIHATQFDIEDIQCMGLGILHLSNLSITQRLRANRHKLLQENMISPEASYEEIASIEITSQLERSLVSKRCILETRSLLERMKTHTSIQTPHERVISLRSDGTLEFGSEDVQTLFNDYLSREHDWQSSTLRDNPLK